MIFNLIGGGGSSEILIGIKVSTAPTKVSYKAGEALDLTGMVVQSVTSDGDNETYTDVTGWTTDIAEGTVLYESTKSITVSWTSNGKTYVAVQAITVTRVLSSIAFTAQPTATSYAYGAALDMTGAVLTATFNSGATEVVTPTYSPAEGTALTTSGTNTIAASYTENGVTKTATTTVDVAYPIYGVEWDGTSTTKLSRTDAASAFTDPVPYVVGASSYSSPFDGIQPWAGMVRSTDSSAGEVVAIPKFYYKWTKTGTKLKLQITQAAQTGFSVSPAHADRGDGTGERSVVYVGRYHSCSTYKSTTGQSPVASITRSSARSSIHNLGTKIWQYDIAMRCTIQMLYLVEFADWNSQNVIGYGCSLSSSIQNVGLSDSMPYHTGTMQSSRTTYGAGVQYRYIEGLWENVMNWLDGAYYGSNGMNVIKNPSSFSDSSGGTSVGIPTGGWASELAIPSVSGYDWAIYPSAAAGDGTNYISDRWYFNASNPCLRSGGYYSQEQSYGIWYMNSAGASSAVGNIGCRLQLLP